MNDLFVVVVIVVIVVVYILLVYIVCIYEIQLFIVAGKSSGGGGGVGGGMGGPLFANKGMGQLRPTGPRSGNYVV